MKDFRNYVQLIGNTGKDVELKTFETGTKKASVSFATTDYYKNTKGELVQQTQWHNLIAWGKNAELLERVVEKGDQLIVKGSINYRSYESNDETKYITEFLVEDFMKTTKSSQDRKVNSKVKEEVPTPF